MLKKVIKKSGKKQELDVKKIKICIERACKNKGISRDRLQIVQEKILKRVEAIAKKREITSAEIRDIVLKNLHALHPAVVRGWIAYEILKLQSQA